MQEQCHGKSVPEYTRQLNILMCNVKAEILLILYTSRYHISTETILIVNNKYTTAEWFSQRMPERREPECLKIDKENQRVKVRSRARCTKKRLHKRDPSSLPSLMNRFLYKKNPALLLVPLLFSSFPIFWTFLKAAGRKMSLFSAKTLPSTRSLRQTALKLTSKGLDYTQVGTLPEPSVSLIFDSERF